MSAAKTLEVERWWEETASCCVCGDDISEGDQVVHEPAGVGSWVQPAHPWCSVRNGYRLTYPVGMDPEADPS